MTLPLNFPLVWYANARQDHPVQLDPSLGIYRFTVLSELIPKQGTPDPGLWCLGGTSGA